MEKEVREAMKKAKELERTPIPSREEIAAIYKEGLQEAEKLRKLLEPEWFVKDVHKPGKKKAKQVKKGTKKRKNATKKAKPKRAQKKRSPSKKAGKRDKQPRRASSRKKKSL